MFLKRVEISGFKSFATKAAFDFSSSAGSEKGAIGIVAIVGPNGSGKSNVADAIRWAMGEQSMKMLRGKKSEDIIFAGSGKRARLGSASVTLYFDNSDKRIPLEFAEVSITRKLFRSGDTEYLINGSRVRLIDVVDILAKAGIGKGSYSVLTQGMSDAVLSATPVERRAIIEDAAGVKQYQIKKDRALKKMETTRENLVRVKSLIVEIEPHLKMLKRQAEKAEKGRSISEALREKQTKLYSFLWHSFQAEKESVLADKNELGAKMMNVQREVDILNDAVLKESKVTEDFSRQSELEKKRESFYHKINALEKELAIAEAKLEIEKERQIEEKIKESVPVDLHYVRLNLKRIHESQEKLIERLENAESIEEIQDIKEFARAIQQDLYDLGERAGQKEIIEEKVNPEYQEAVKKKEEIIRRLEARKEEVRKEIAEDRSEVSRIIAAIEEEIERGKQSRLRFFELEKNLRKKQDELNRFRDDFNEVKIRLTRVEVHEEDLATEVKQELKTNADELEKNDEKIEKEILEKEVMRLKIQMEQIGGIDPMVSQEYEETQKRFDFLNQESDDLEHAMESLKEVIKEMDQKISKVFAEAFTEISKEFTKYFRIIFSGGSASLDKLKAKNLKLKAEDGDNSENNVNEIGSVDEIEAVGEVDEAEIGVDISACPPGKRISNLSMLSGGERSLTSLALLFAIISYNPPPFAVLDEVEAALDEANSRRFGRILSELSRHTQFVAITHNRETMRQASLLYGVTMGDDGVSKVLSVRIDQIGQGGKIIERK